MERKKAMKKVLTLIVVGLIVLNVGVATKIAEACEGARPMAMGGAFTGLADDANATYWNPAALGLLEDIEATYTGIAYDRNAYNYDDWVSMVFPSEALFPYSYTDWGTFGLSFMNNTDKGDYSFVYYDINIDRDVEINNRWYVLSYGRELTEIAEGLCIGANLRYQTFEETLKDEAIIEGITYQGNASDEDNQLAVDLALYYLWKNWSYGLLVQNVNEPELTVFGTEGKYNVNLRPGIAYRFGEKFILSGELYDAADKSDYRNLRIGAEAKLTDNIDVRLGGYNITATEKTGRAITGGIGLNSGHLFGNIEAEFSYGTLYWYESKVDTKDKFTHLVSLSVKF
jgi:hypothetical protein